MLMARDTARDEAQKLHRKWLKHQAFMAELARNKEWLAKIEQVSGGDQGMMMMMMMLEGEGGLDGEVRWAEQVSPGWGEEGGCHAKGST